MARPKKSAPKRHQRDWGQGTVRQVRPGVWRAWRSRVHTPGGLPVRPTKTFYGAGAQDAATSWAKGDPEPAVMYLGQHLESYLALRKPSLDPSTYDIYRRDVEACGELLFLPIHDVSREAWQARANSLLEVWSRYHVVVWKSNISVMLRAAMPKYLMHNPILGVKIPTEQEEPPKVWRQDEIDRLLSVSAGGIHEAWLVFSLGTGVRLGEARALLWSDVDLAAKTATIRASLDNSTSVRGPTKTRKLRVIDMPDEVVAMLADHAKRQQPGQKLVFGHEGRAYRARTYRSWLATRCREAGIDAHPPHSLRHTCASLAFARRVPVPDVAKQLGHTPETCQKTYSHYINEGLRVMAKALGGALRHRFSGPKRKVGTRNGTRQAP